MCCDILNKFASCKVHLSTKITGYDCRINQQFTVKKYITQNSDVIVQQILVVILRYKKMINEYQWDNYPCKS